MNFQLILRSVGRVLWFAVAGTVLMALVGVVAGSVTGALMIFLNNLTTARGTRSLFGDVGTGALVGSAYAVSVGLISGAIAFGSAGTMACFSNLPRKVFGASWRLAWRATFIATAVGGVLGPINMLLFARLLRSTGDSFSGYMLGVIGGFIIGTFYGALVGAKREVRRQKEQDKTN